MFGGRKFGLSKWRMVKRRSRTEMRDRANGRERWLARETGAGKSGGLLVDEGELWLLTRRTDICKRDIRGISCGNLGARVGWCIAKDM